jgi:hypothetical protein
VFLVSEPTTEATGEKGDAEGRECDSYIAADRDEGQQQPIELRKEYIFNTCTGGEGISDFL